MVGSGVDGEKSPLFDTGCHLDPDEVILHRNNCHWIILFWPAFFVVFFLLPGFVALSGVPARGGSSGGTFVLGTVGAFFVALGASVGFTAYVAWKTGEIILTNSRLLLPTGIFRSEITSVKLVWVKSTTVRLSLLGKTLGFGTVIFPQANGPVTYLKKIPDPIKFEKLLRSQLTGRLKSADLIPEPEELSSRA